MTPIHKLLALAVTGGFTLAASAQPLFTDDFESDAPGSQPSSWDASSSTALVTTDPGTVFGSSNQYVDIAGDAQGLFENVAGLDGELSSFAFDLYEPSNTLNGLIIIGFTSANGDLNSDAAARIGLDNGVFDFYTGSGGSFNYDQDKPYRLQLVANDTADPTTVNSESLAAGDFGVWFTDLNSDVTTFAGSSNMNTSNPIGRVGFRTFAGSTFDQQIHADNVAVNVIPEPSTLMLSVIALLGIIAVGRRGHS